MSEHVVRRLVLVRHGQTEWNRFGRMQGGIDTDLSETGRCQAKETARHLSALRPLAIVSSDLRRASDTAAILAEGCADTVPVQTDTRLRETSLGDWEGLDHLEVDERNPGERARWRFDATFAPPSGESKVAVAARAVPVVEELNPEYPDWVRRPIILVAHGGLISALTAALLGLPVAHWSALGALGNAAWVELAGWGDPPRWRLDVWNGSARAAPDVG